MEIFIIIINLLKNLIMGCGCKNKGNQAAQQPPQSAQPAKEQVKSPNIQESIKKVVEKYYNKK